MYSILLSIFLRIMHWDDFALNLSSAPMQSVKLTEGLSDDKRGKRMYIMF
jgi:excinuclease UvrABC ATPase subunit